VKSTPVRVILEFKIVSHINDTALIKHGLINEKSQARKASENSLY
jgi:hypothetical protein